MKFMIGFRILLIVILMVSTAGCLEWSDGNSFVAHQDAPVINDGSEVVPKGEEPPKSEEPPKGEELPGIDLMVLPDDLPNNPVPEPMTLLLLGPALLGLLGFKKKKA